jgi:hypothetical protein
VGIETIVQIASKQKYDGIILENIKPDFDIIEIYDELGGDNSITNDIIPLKKYTIKNIRSYSLMNKTKNLDELYYSYLEGASEELGDNLDDSLK